ncbi:MULTISPECIES: alpha/beta hydrolase [unclassified Arcicella]|uniref:alpha/beta hydrolase n=1 Tax=unclassified Arcicella TaxID=2644986 RepID=UPI002861EF77|nr:MULTISPECIES: alpha/beta hydrolase [unclassified Arcicella]MDR6561588.1 acetyl esterase/lipase [Arcicella sp. BE51]MDR6812368.1 acetyl esterase/lipase [Arcicella sp. BE140]MDR6823860.1 acetyl esterase/lipase [Arcicella sp. BE139]
MKKIILTFSFLCCMKYAQAQQEMPLYPDGVPNAKQVPNTQKSVTDKNGVLRISEVTVPTLTVYPADADKANGTAVIICPGGGYAILAASHEGSDVASVFNKMGVTAFVLKYRLPNSDAQVDKSIAPLQDAQQALRTVRKDAAKYGINPSKIGIMGFSAGGHLASTAGTHFNKQVGEVTSEVSVRPDFMILGYPVITFKDFGHAGSRINLIGKTPDQALIDEYSNELHVTAETPPTFLVHAGDDTAVPVRNSLEFYQGLQKNGVLAELVIYPKGGHGFGLNNKTTKEKWMDNVKNWMDSLGLLSK